MRYSKMTLDFWVIVKQLFKGKGNRFFTGEKSSKIPRLQSSENDLRQISGTINFAVPASNAILTRESNKYKLTAEKPGILTDGLKAFVQSKPAGIDCKISSWF